MRHIVGVRCGAAHGVAVSFRLKVRLRSQLSPRSLSATFVPV
jgi:hypothetical protein